ncbi:type II secretion system minor pseudopilin GspI [Sphingorhabdus sp.]|uniref:type II secretion system minor pseudopilin GspI n=1 Tax=Sphingorhabdus sp. TaxID=1902408 RepID=UPI00268843F7|nr:type II secretion system minor pseudopilin GspI [Sphingorhabdus sp.]HQS13533.1 type II secretion system minor pseudopilin GspI [Sphingorhabdus sp.]HQS80762.1 type II secretion system minor pseudopilin GspI [Sphingorhabdus sp.]
MSGKPQPTQNGFTLLEIMVALAIFSLAALAMVRLQGYSVRSTSNLGDSSMAWQVARNVAVEILSNPAPPTLGETRGEEMNGGQNWRWTATASPTDDTRLVMVDIDVVGTGNAALRKARLTIARPVEQ